ncbi:uncharacterized protein LOC105183613 isoform X2 [Harpegnathos saltator]|uniref:uncharacterized protein LOC105183613 isoform X2 n=1 Tax=Harpegnathos saltator TaxID=610380 RepID=UPI000DBEE56E|nr:uncharacterized protein LOC105183613 isoform X2 [Harpegnathos saltator]
MAQNTVEDTKSAVDNTEMSETLTYTVDKADSRDDKGNADEAMNPAKAESTSEENKESDKKKEIDDNSVKPLDSKEQSNTDETDLDTKSKEETDSKKQSTSEKTIKTGTKENKSEANCSADTSNDADERANTFFNAEEQLSEILKVVHEDLDIKYFQKSTNQLTNANDKDTSDKDTSSTEQQNKKAETVEEQDTMESVTCVTVQDAEEKKDSRESRELEKSDEKSEVGIVGPPTAVSELINEEELGGGDSADQKDHIAEWVEKSAKADTATPANAEDDVAVEERKQRTNGSEVETKWKNEEAVSISSRKSQKIVSNIIKKSIKCLNKMHAMESASGNGKNVDAAENAPSTSPKVPQSQQNGAALPEETAASPSALDYGRVKIEKEAHQNVKINKKSFPITSTPIASTSQQKSGSSRLVRSKSAEIVGKKRKSPNGQQDSTNGPPKPKKTCCTYEERESSIKSLVGEEKTVDALEIRENELLQRMQFLEKLARDKEKEWNQILYTRKLTEEAYVRLQRKRQMMRLTNSGTQPEDVPPTSLEARWMNSDGTSRDTVSRERSFEFKSELSEESSLNASSTKKQNVAKVGSQRQTASSKSSGENSRKQNETSSPETRQLGEGRQGARVEVTSIIANHRKMFPDPAPKRGRRTRNSVNVNLTAGGAMVETGHNADSRPSSTDSCKSNPSATECQNTVNFREMVYQFNRLSQHQGEPARPSQNYPDVTLQPVPSGHNASPVPENTIAPSRSLLHGILTNNTSSRPNNFPLTLAKLLTAPERERNSPAAAAAAAATAAATTPMVPMSQQTAGTQHLLQAYQGSSLGSISELLSSSTARTEITITPVVNTPPQSHSNNDDVEEDTAASDDRDGKYSMSGRDAREDRDNPPRCQGCHQRAAQFVCAGCANQWYCSRECQVASWDEHSEICSG